MSIVISRSTQTSETLVEIEGEDKDAYAADCLVCGYENIYLLEPSTRHRADEGFFEIKVHDGCDHNMHSSFYSTYVQQKTLDLLGGLYVEFGVVAGEGENFLIDPLPPEDVNP